MDIWNTWTALATGLVIGTCVGMVLTALLTISGMEEPPQPAARKKEAERRRANAPHGDHVETPNGSMNDHSDSRTPLPLH